MQLPELRMSFADRALLAKEIEQSLRCGRAFLNQATPIPVLSDCVLVLIHPEHGGELRLPAQVVMANEHGTGLSLTTLSAQHHADLNAFPDSSPPEPEPEPEPVSARTVPPPAARTTLPPGAASRTTQPPPAAGSSTPPPAARTTLPPSPSNAPAPASTSVPPHPPESAEASGGDLAAEDDLDFPACDEQDLEYSGPESGSSRPTELQSESRQERLRHLSPAEQLKVARRGELADRLAVERMYGKQVWEALLQNPRLTIPEVAKIARKGTVPRPLLDMILDNAGWTKADAVRRALLSNPKIGADSVMKLLRLTSKHELKLIEKGTAYGAAVREAARKLLRT